MISTRAKRQTPVLSPLTQGGILPTRRTSPHPWSSERVSEFHHDPASLSAALRELAVRAHHAVRVAEGLPSSPVAAAESRRELSEVLARIVQLQRSLHVQSLSGLSPYVASLRQKVEDHL
jgi:hypothetical protein